MHQERDEARQKIAGIIATMLKENELVLTKENVRRCFDLLYHQIPDEKIVNAVYKLIRH